jgi:hypothetical protein
MNRFFTLRPVLIMLAAVGLVMLPAPLSAGERPHLSEGTAQFVSPTDFVGTGKATHLGLYDEIGSAIFSPTADPTVLQIDGWAIYTASNGDQLYATFTGNLNGLTGVITATLTYGGGTGRFSDASGSATLSGQLLPGGKIAVAVKGTIDY